MKDDGMTDCCLRVYDGDGRNVTGRAAEKIYGAGRAPKHTDREAFFHVKGYLPAEQPRKDSELLPGWTVKLGYYRADNICGEMTFDGGVASDGDLSDEYRKFRAEEGISEAEVPFTVWIVFWRWER